MVEWRPVIGLEDRYEVSDEGEIRLKSTRRKRRASLTYKGYMTLQLPHPKTGKKVTRTVHSVVAEAFLGRRIGVLQVNHKDGNKQNNRLINLEWVSPSENARHAIATGLRKKTRVARKPAHDRKPSGMVQSGSRNFNARLKENDVLEIREKLLSGAPTTAIRDGYGISMSLVYAIQKRRRWGHI